MKTVPQTSEWVHHHMKKDTDLDSLRSREDFKKLMAELDKLSQAAGKK